MGATRDSLDRLRAALNPLEIFREAIPSLKQAGRRWKGLCPFHNERTPSFTVDPERGWWHCFGSCNAGGDVFAFVMRRDGVDFAEALRAMSDRTGVRLEWEGRAPGDDRASKERDAVLELLEEASQFYHRTLTAAAEGEASRRLLAERHVTPESIAAFRLGHVPARNGFLDAALKRGVPIERLTAAGLAVRGAGGRTHDPLADRLCFPIFDPYGRVVAFGGRVLGDAGGPKYLNSPETPVYAKSRQLYGLYQGRAWLRDHGAAVLVEGYMDVVGCHQAGIKGAVAPCGTAFTREQAQLLKRYVKETVLLYDPDEAGVKASWRTAQVLLAEGLFPRVATVPDGLDPDDYAARKGAGALVSVVDRAQDVVDFWLERLAPADAGEGLQGRVRRGEELVAFLRGVPNAILQEEWLKKGARRLSLEESSLRRELDKGRSSAPVRAAAAPVVPAQPAAPAARPAAAPKRPAGPAVRSAEEEALQLLAAHPDAWREDLSTDLFADPRCRAAFAALALARGRDPAAAAAALPEGDAAWWSRLLVEEKAFKDPSSALERLMKGLQRAAADRELKALQREADRMLSGAAPRDEAKLARLRHLTASLKKI